jgi:glycerophosphoryl diester phosphodiesterase
VEGDVHATSDGVLVAFHDPTLDRVTDRHGRVAQLPYREVSAALIGGTEPIPLFADLLDAWPDARFNVDVKDEPAIGPLAEVLRRTRSWDRVCVCSFSSRRLSAARHAIGRPVCTALSPSGLAAVRLAGGLPGGRAMIFRRLDATGARCAQVPAMIATRSFIRRAHDLGLQVHVWTINDRTEMTCLLDLGADGIMTDDTVLLRDVMAERGLWPPAAPQPQAPPARRDHARESAAGHPG